MLQNASCMCHIENHKEMLWLIQVDNKLMQVKKMIFCSWGKFTKEARWRVIVSVWIKILNYFKICIKSKLQQSKHSPLQIFKCIKIKDNCNDKLYLSKYTISFWFLITLTPGPLRNGTQTIVCNKSTQSLRHFLFCQCSCDAARKKTTCCIFFWILPSNTVQVVSR